MATVVLQAAGGLIGGLVGGPVGAIVGRALGAAAGAVVDQSLFGSPGRNTVGPRLTTLAGLTSNEGAPVPRLYGRARIGGQMIWATRFLETSTTTSSGGGGKGGGGGPTTTTYNYAANFAIGLCEGPIAMVRRVWADGTEIDPSTIAMRVYNGDEAQEPDPLIVAKEGAQNAPAYRGLAYVVFELMPLANYGDRIPQMSFEILRPVAGLGAMIRAVDLIPGATEFGYSPAGILQTNAPGVSQWINRNELFAPSDWVGSIETLQALCPNLRSVALVVSWFGDDLRAGHCTIAPRVETPSRNVAQDWTVAGLIRDEARVVSQYNGAPAYGGTPSDASVVAAILDLKSRGLSVVFYPFVMMDIPAGNELQDPWTGASTQPAYPWRGRITCDPAPGVAGSPDGTGAAGGQVAAFFGAGGYNAFVANCVSLCQQAGGVDAFLIGSELAALTRVRSASGVYPAAAALAALAASVKAALGGATKVSYSADWTEYGSHVLDGGAEARFPLDPLWSSPNVDFVGIDAYFPLSDWRDGTAHLDASIARSIYDVGYLGARVSSGEDYDWYYASAEDRDAQIRAPITDGLANKPWVFRAKDLVGWWSNPHVERVGGAELSAPTDWAPMAKPIWLMEFGCPAVDRGANAPNVFPDPKSSEAGLPPYSRGFRDDLMQARAIEAFIGHFDPATAPANPVSPVYGGPMVDPARLHVWAWDARPFPPFPALTGVWSDAANWETGHWLTGRLEGVPIDRLVAQIVADSDCLASPIARPAIDGFVDGYALDKAVSVRDALDPLASLFGFDAVASSGALTFSGVSSPSAYTLSDDDLVPAQTGELATLTRGQESDTPSEIELSFTNGDLEYQPAAVLSRRVEGGSRRQAQAEAAIVTDTATAQHLLDMWLQDMWVARETATFAVRPGLIAIEAGDAVTLTINGSPRLFRITRVTDNAQRTIEARAMEPSVFDAAPPRFAATPQAPPALPGPPIVAVLDLAIARDTPATMQYVAALASPWMGPLALWEANGPASYAFSRTLDYSATIGATLDAVGPGPAGRFDNANVFRVALSGGALVSVSDLQLLGGANTAALRGPDGQWEIVGFANAELVAAGVYKLSRLLRGLGGNEVLAARTLAAGADFVLLDKAVAPLVAGLSELGVAHAWKCGLERLSYADPTYVGFSSTAGASALMPYAPVQPKAARSLAGVTISFIRRGRIDADAWEPIDIPLGEDSEAYQIDILDGGVVARTLSCGAQQALYAIADELADFGAPNTALDLRVYQISAVVGRGFPLAANVPVF